MEHLSVNKRSSCVDDFTAKTILIEYCPKHTAAPDMYEALKSALALLDKQREECNSAFSILPHPRYEEGPIAKAARKALAKAEGDNDKQVSKPEQAGSCYDNLYDDPSIGGVSHFNNGD
jgi:hypothetical protein